MKTTKNNTQTALTVSNEFSLLLPEEKEKEFKKEIQALENKVTNLVIQDQSGFETAVLICSDVKKINKAITDYRDSVIKPIKNKITEYDNKIKSFTQPLTKAEAEAKSKMLTFQKEEETKARIAEEKARLQAEKQNAKTIKKEGKNSENLIDVNTIEVQPEVQKTTNVGNSKATFVTVRKWKLSNINEVPSEYFILDEAKISKVVKAGIPSIPGITITEEQTLAVR